jgi:hypothetical protein
MVKCTRSRRSRNRNNRSRNNRSRNNRNRNRNNRNRNQRGGMAPFEYKDGLLLDTATRAQAEVSGLDKFIAESQVLSRQAGGTRYKSRKSRRNRKQRGGELASFSANYELLAPGVPRGVNPQFSTEASVNPLYSQTRGAQF